MLHPEINHELRQHDRFSIKHNLLSIAVPELIHDAGRGGWFDLREVHNMEPGMSPMQIWCNEAQERYVLIVAADRIDEFETLCDRERCPVSVIGTLTDDGRLVVTDREFDNRPVDMPMQMLLGNPPKMTRDVARAERRMDALDLDDRQRAAVAYNHARGRQTHLARIRGQVTPELDQKLTRARAALSAGRHAEARRLSEQVIHRATALRLAHARSSPWLWVAAFGLLLDTTFYPWRGLGIRPSVGLGFAYVYSNSSSSEGFGWPADVSLTITYEIRITRNFVIAPFVQTYWITGKDFDGLFYCFGIEFLRWFKTATG